MEIENIEIGKEPKKIEPRKVVVVGVETEDIEIKGEKKTRIHLKIEYNKEKILAISKAKYERNSKIKVEGLWKTLDGDEKLAYYSVVSHLLRHYKCSKINELIGRQIDTTLDEYGYLVVQAY